MGDVIPLTFQQSMELICLCTMGIIRLNAGNYQKLEKSEFIGRLCFLEEAGLILKGIATYRLAQIRFLKK